MRIARSKAFLCSVALLGALVAQSAFPVAKSPDALVGDTVREVQQIVRQDPALQAGDKQRTLDLVEKKILPHFDFEQMSRLVLGKNWRRATSEQRERFVKEFQTLLIRTYGTALNEYRDQKIVYLPMRAEPNAQDVTVRTEVQRSGAQPIPIDYSMLLENGQWKVYDVVIQWVSLVTNYRTSFSSEISQGGFDQLLKKLIERNQQATT